MPPKSRSPATPDILMRDLDAIVHLLGEAQALQAQLAQRQAPRWTKNRAAWVVQALTDLKAAVLTETPEKGA